MYIKKLSPIVRNKEKGIDVPAWELYGDVMEIFSANENNDDERVRDVIERYRAQVFGETCFQHAPRLYNELSLITELKISIDEWNEYSIRHRALLTAHNYLKGMVSVIDSHYHAQKENREKAAREAKQQMEDRRKGR